MPGSRDYQPLPKVEEDNYRRNGVEDDPEDNQTTSAWLSRLIVTHSPKTAVWLIGSLSLLLVIGIVSSTTRGKCTPRDVLSYSPAQDAVKYHIVVYLDAIHHKTKYMGELSPELDAAWEADYDLISRIPKWQADNMDTPADELPNDPGYHAVMLDIFHSLHCLNEVRMTLNPEYYGSPSDRFNTTEERVKIHLDHCIEHIRMALWCNADISPIPFQKGEHGFSASHTYTHTCRDAESILEWARENKIHGDF